MNADMHCHTTTHTRPLPLPLLHHIIDLQLTRLHRTRPSDLHGANAWEDVAVPGDTS